jgi:hypothetical protein
MNWIARVGAVALGVAWGCTTTNESHCGNQNGDTTCIERGSMYCNVCIATNDGCQKDPITDPACRGSNAGTESSGATSTVTSDATTMSTSMSTSMTTTMSTTNATDDSTSGGPPPPCPNGMIDEGEECDGEELNGETCETRGFGPGQLACTPLCEFDVSGCEPMTGCGDHVITPPEECEPADTGEPEDLGDQTCATVNNQLGGDGLACGNTCRFDTSACCIAAGFECNPMVPCCGSCVNLVVSDQCMGEG